MTSVSELHKEGDHRYVTIPTAATEVTFTPASLNTSSNDTSTIIYFDNFATSAYEFDMVADQVIQIIGVNGTDFTDPIPVTANANYSENWGLYNSIKIKTLTNNTQISLRIR